MLIFEDYNCCCNCRNHTITRITKGATGATGTTGATGVTGTAGATPRIGANGNWFINDVDKGLFFRVCLLGIIKRHHLFKTSAR